MIKDLIVTVRIVLGSSAVENGGSRSTNREMTISVFINFWSLWPQRSSFLFC